MKWNNWGLKNSIKIINACYFSPDLCTTIIWDKNPALGLLYYCTFLFLLPGFYHITLGFFIDKTGQGIKLGKESKQFWILLILTYLFLFQVQFRIKLIGSHKRKFNPILKRKKLIGLFLISFFRHIPTFFEKN